MTRRRRTPATPRTSNRDARPPAARSVGAELIRVARRIATLQRQRRRLTQQRKAVDDELRMRRRELRALAAGREASPDQQLPPLRQFGEHQH